MDNFIISQISNDDKETLEKIYRLRVVCRQEEGYITFEKFPNGWFDEEDKTATHFTIHFQDQLIAAGRINFYSSLSLHPNFPALKHYNNISFDCPIGYLSRLVVVKEFRRRNLSKLLVNKREEFAKYNNIKSLFADVHGFQVENFIKYGYHNIGKLDTTKINWILDPLDQNLMHKQL